MKKLTLTLVVLIFVVLTGYFGYDYYKKSTAPLKKAVAAEADAQYQDAYDNYINALIDICPSMKIPDINKSKVVDQKIWKSDLAKFVAHLLQTGTKPGNFEKIVERINNYSEKYSHQENKIVNMVQSELDSAAFNDEWKNTFYASTAPFDQSHVTLASDAFSKNGSFLQLYANKGFTYEVTLVSLSNGTQTTCTVFSEGETSVLAFPGDYILTVKSTVEFSKSEIWKSGTTVIPVTIPARSSNITGTIITKVSRPKGE